MLLKDLLPSLDARDWSLCLEELTEQGIIDAGSLLFAPEQLADDALDAQRLVQRYLEVEGATAVTVRDRQRSWEQQRATTGCSALDDLLDGGWQAGEVVEVCGGKSSGKSLLTLLAILRQLFHNVDSSALLIDTEGHFSAERAYQILVKMAAQAGTPSSTPPGVRDVNLERILQRLHITRRSDVAGVVSAFNEVMEETKKAGTRLRFIVIDSFTVLYQDKLNTSASVKGHASMVALLRRLRGCAGDPEHPLTVLLVNNSVSALPVAPLATFAATKRKPALGPTLSHSIDATLWLSTGQETLPEQGIGAAKLCLVEVWRSRRETSGTFCAFYHDGLAILEDHGRA